MDVSQSRFPFKGTKAWDSDLELPYFPLTNNGHCYFAYTLRLEKPMIPIGVLRALRDVATKTEYGFKRWKSDIPISHDEIRGWVFTCWYVGMPLWSEELVQELEKHGGNLEVNQGEDLRRNVFRIPDMEASIHAARKQAPTPLESLAYVASKIYQALTVKQGEASGILRTWLYIPILSKYWIPSVGILLWNFILKLRGFDLSTALQLELQVPEITERARGKSFLD